MSPSHVYYHDALYDFQSARQKAGLQEVLSHFTGRSNRLLSYDEVAEKLKLHIRADRGIQQIPLDAIIGSTGRYTDFTRTFLPRRPDDQQRWAGVKAALAGNLELPPIEVYKVGEVYFVIDGNHRVSIARQEKFISIEAHVIEVRTNIPLTPDVQPDDLIIKAEYAEFLDATRIMDLRPNVDLTVTIPGQYDKLMEQICVQECLLGDNCERAVPFQVAVQAWYDNIYIPLAETIRDRGLLRWFPDRTVTDLHIWISENRSALEKELGWQVQSDIAASDLILKRSLRNKPGSWRKARTISRYIDSLFTDILVPLSGDPECWDSLDQALIIAKREGARIHGLHVLGSKEQVKRRDSRGVRKTFDRRCNEANVDGKLLIEPGNVTRKICERATMTDLIVLKIAHPPQGGLSTLRYAFRSVITNSARPILCIPESATLFQRALLAYDGSLRAKEALFVATYLAEKWNTELIIFTALEGGKIKDDIHDYVRRYLEVHEVNAMYVFEQGAAKDKLRGAVEEYHADLLLMGGYGGSVLRSMVIGSTLDFLLHASKIPLFVCS